MDDYDILVVGAGLTGSAISRILADSGKKVKIIERRNHIAGNLYDEKIDGVIVQKYGPHIFHTSKQDTYDFISRFAKWNPYKLHYATKIDGKYYEMPFGFETIDQMFSQDDASNLKNELIQKFPNRDKISITEMLECEGAIGDFSNSLYEKEYKIYTAAQWGLHASSISKSIFRRVPFYLRYGGDYYENDIWQMIPEDGFTKFIERMLADEKISVELNRDGNEEALEQLSRGKEVYFTGPIDSLFSYQHGKLPYRSLRFDYSKEKFGSQQYGILACPEPSTNQTRKTNYSILPLQTNGYDFICTEYSQDYNLDKNEPFYPLKSEEALEIYKKYEILAKEIPNLHICGRLGAYKYMNMDEALEKAIDLANETKNHSNRRI